MKYVNMTATFDPDLAELLEAQGREWGASPASFMAMVNSIVERHYREATLLPPTEGDDQALHLLVSTDIAIVFAIEGPLLVILGLGKPGAYGTVVGDRLVIEGKKSVH